MKQESVKMALVETMACDMFYAAAQQDKGDDRQARIARHSATASVAGLTEAGVRLGFDRSELNAEAQALAATPHKMRPLMLERNSEMKGKYA